MNIVEKTMTGSKMILDELDKLVKSKKTITCSSSFQTQSLPLLHLISQTTTTIPIAFIDTGYHFPETLIFLEKVKQLLNLNIVKLKPQQSKIQQLDASNRLLYSSDPDRCCFINKTDPLANHINKFDVWISGIRSDQTKVRAGLKKFEITPNDVTRYHPMLNWTKEMIEQYSSKYDLPQHPLSSLEVDSIGCMPCTTCPKGADERSGRWAGLRKLECGIHIDLVKK